MVRVRIERVFGPAWLPGSGADYESANQKSGDWCLKIERWRIFGRFGWQCITEHIPLEDKIACPKHGSPESCQEHSCSYCPCEAGAHDQCWKYDHECCCHGRLGIQSNGAQGNCPPEGCSHTMEGPESVGWNTSPIESIVRDNWKEISWYYRLLCRIFRTKEQVILRAIQNMISRST